MRSPIYILFASLFLVTGCKAIEKKGGFKHVAMLVDERTGGQQVHWKQGTPEDAEVAEKIHSLLMEELTLDAAVQIALLNNRSLQAEYEELGVAQADLVQAGLLKNPSFLFSARFPDRSPSATNTEFEVMQNFLDLLLLPVRKKLAAMEFMEAKLRVSNAVLGVAAETKSAYFELQGEIQVSSMLRMIAEASESAYQIAQRQYEAGNISDLDLPSHQALYEQAKLDLADSEEQVQADREHLNRLMGLWGEDTEWRVNSKLPDIPEAEIQLEHLETLAVSQRLDLSARRREVEKLVQALSTTQKWRWVAAAEVGASTERDSDGLRVTGPHLQLEVPVFDQGQAMLARLQAQLRQSRQNMAELEVNIRSEVRMIRYRLLLARRKTEQYQKILIPLREQIVAESQRHYNFMLIGVFQLLQAKKDEVETYRSYIEAVRDYWMTFTDLERAVGGRLRPAVETIPSTVSPVSESSENSKHSHQN